MTKEELKCLCENWNGDGSKFQKIVLGFLNLDKSHLRKLSHKLGIPMHFVEKWSEGKGRPHGAMQPMVISKIIELIGGKDVKRMD